METGVRQIWTYCAKDFQYASVSPIVINPHLMYRGRHTFRLDFIKDSEDTVKNRDKAYGKSEILTSLRSSSFLHESLQQNLRFTRMPNVPGHLT